VFTQLERERAERLIARAEAQCERIEALLSEPSPVLTLIPGGRDEDDA
jgi:hypothetical protein